MINGFKKPLNPGQKLTFSTKFLGTITGQTSASIAAFPVQRSASAGLTHLVFLKIFQNTKELRKMLHTNVSNTQIVVLLKVYLRDADI